MLQIHEKIKQARVSANLTQDELAEKLGIERSTYQYWEKKTPGIDKIKQVAKALNLSEDYFLGDKDENLVTEANEQAPEYGNNKSIEELIVSNRILAEANKTLAEAHKIISKNNEDLIQMTKAAFNWLPQGKDPLSLVDPGTNVAGTEGYSPVSDNKENAEQR